MSNTIQSFRDKSLHASGIKEESQKSLVRFPVNENRSTKRKNIDLEGDAFFRSQKGKSSDPNAPEPAAPTFRTEIRDRYISGTFNQQWQIDPKGEDMVMLYLDLDRHIMQYEPPKSSKTKDFYRVRFQFPERHQDKNGDKMKYQSPPYSGSRIWIPEKILQAYEQKTEVQTLIVTEGEKKADKVCQEGLFSVGISGIFNLAINNVLPIEFDRIIRVCKVKNIVFLLDSDLFDLSPKKGRPANARPHNFYAAVRNFRDYFKALSNDDIDLEIYFAYNKPNDKNEKGIDDLLAGSMAERVNDVVTDLVQQLADKHLEGTYIQAHKITADSDGKLKQYFGLSNAREFADKYKAKLKSLGDKFKFWNTEWKFKEDGTVELAQPLLPEETFWGTEMVGEGKSMKEVLSFNYYNCYNFLKARGFGRYPMGNSDNGDFIYIRKDGRIVTEVKAHHIKDFVHNFTESIGEIKVLNMLYRGNKYLGPDSLSNLKFMDVDFVSPSKENQFLCFDNKYWKITAEAIEEQPIHDLPNFVWKNKTINFEPTLIENFVKVTTEEHNGQKYYDYEISDGAFNCHFFAYLTNASRIYWRQTHPLEKHEPITELSDEQEYEQILSLLNKMTAIGYLLHSYRNPSKTKAVVGMDTKISEVGQSFGRTGKSLIGDALEHMMPTVFIDGKKGDMEKDPFLFEEVDERTELIYIDDIDKNLDFERFFTIITGRLTVNKKGKSKFKIAKQQTPKLYITTNHAISGDSDSYLDRQILLGFSDYYSAKRKPVDDFGCLFFDEWSPEQWNLFYNLMATCLHLYLQFDVIEAPNSTLIKRRLRQEIGDEFLNWAETYFMEDSKDANGASRLNSRYAKEVIFEELLDKNPHMKKYMTATTFKKKIKKFCEYKGLLFNPKTKGADDKSGGVEFFTIADNKFVAQ